jgi:hypothetical protein
MEAERAQERFDKPVKPVRMVDVVLRVASIELHEAN